MAAVIMFGEYGAPDVLQLRTVPNPEPGPGEVRIRVKAAGVQPVVVPSPPR